MKKLFLLLTVMFSYVAAFSQQDVTVQEVRIWNQLSVGKQGASPITDNSAWLEIGKEGTSRGFLLPRTEKSFISNPKRGNLIYVISQKIPSIYNGTTWDDVVTKSTQIGLNQVLFDANTGIITFKRGNSYEDIPVELGTQNDFQDVTYDGTNLVFSRNNGTTKTVFLPAGGGSDSAGVGTLAQVTLNGSITPTPFGFSDTTNNHTGLLSSVSLSGDRSYVFPDASGNIALQEWVTAQSYLTTETDPSVNALIKAMPVTTDATTNKVYYWNNGTIERKQLTYADISGTPKQEYSDTLTTDATRYYVNSLFNSSIILNQYSTKQTANAWFDTAKVLMFRVSPLAGHDAQFTDYTISTYTDDAFDNGISIIKSSDVTATRAVILGQRSRGTLNAPTAVLNNDWLFGIVASGYDGVTRGNGGSIDFFVDGTVTTNNVPTRIVFRTGTNGSNRSDRMTISSSGVVKVNKLATGGTAPTQTGTIKMVTTDDNGILGFAAIPSGGGGSQTLQQVLTTGSVLTSNNVINTGANSLKIGANETTSFVNFSSSAPFYAYAKYTQPVTGYFGDQSISLTQDGGAVLSSSGDFLNRGSVTVNQGVTLWSSSPTGGDAYFKMLKDSINFYAYDGRFKIYGLNAGVGTKSLRINPTTGQISYADTTLSSDLSGYVTLATSQTISGVKTFSGQTNFGSNINITSGNVLLTNGSIFGNAFYSAGVSSMSTSGMAANGGAYYNKLDGLPYFKNVAGTEMALAYTLPTATSSVLGGVKIGSTLQISSGVVDVKDVTLSTLTDATTVAWDYSTQGAEAKVTLGGNRALTLSNLPSGKVVYLTLEIIQDGTGSRTVTSWPTIKWIGGAAPTLSTTAGAIDLITFRWDGTTLFGNYGKNYN